MLNEEVPVVIIGGGPAGLAAAIALSAAHIDSLVVECGDNTQPRVGEHLTPTGVSCLQQLGIWTAPFASKHQLCYGVRSSWGEAQIAQSDYIFHPCGSGANLSRPAFDRDLTTFARQQGVRIRFLSRLQAAKKEGDGWLLSLTTPQGCTQVRASFVIDASGRQAAFARSQGQKFRDRDRLVGLVSYLKPRRDRRAEETLLLESCEFGWWYFASLKDNRGVFLYITDSDLLCPGQGGPLRTWHKHLHSTRFFSELACNYQPAKSVVVKSARSQCLDRITGENWLAIGDAAMGFDPLSSMGITKGLKSGIAAAQTISRYFTGETTSLQHYEADRAKEFEEYLQMRSAYYAMERRWPDSPFWQRRTRI